LFARLRIPPRYRVIGAGGKQGPVVVGKGGRGQGQGMTGPVFRRVVAGRVPEPAATLFVAGKGEFSVCRQAGHRDIGNALYQLLPLRFRVGTPESFENRDAVIEPFARVVGDIPQPRDFALAVRVGFVRLDAARD
jgi:hypothetical protein